MRNFLIKHTQVGDFPKDHVISESDLPRGTVDRLLNEGAIEVTTKGRTGPRPLGHESIVERAAGNTTTTALLENEEIGAAATAVKIPPVDPKIPPTDPKLPPVDPKIPPTDPKLPPVDPKTPPAALKPAPSVPAV